MANLNEKKRSKIIGCSMLFRRSYNRFLIVPIKKAMYFGSNCGNTFADNDKTGVDNIEEELEKSIKENSEYK